MTIRFLGKDAKSKVGVSECAVANSVFPFFLVPIMLLVIPEYKRWKIELYYPFDTDHYLLIDCFVFLKTC
jgi:hypothetical protein